MSFRKIKYREKQDMITYPVLCKNNKIYFLLGESTFFYGIDILTDKIHPTSILDAISIVGLLRKKFPDNIELQAKVFEWIILKYKKKRSRNLIIQTIRTGFANLEALMFI